MANLVPPIPGSSDLEATPKASEHLPGFAVVAEFITSDEHGDRAVYRRFNALSARNLIYLHGELYFLETKLRRIDEEDKRIWLSGNQTEQVNVLQAAREWESFVRKGNVQGSRDERRMKVVMGIRKLMKEYRLFSARNILVVYEYTDLRLQKKLCYSRARS